MVQALYGSIDIVIVPDACMADVPRITGRAFGVVQFIVAIDSPQYPGVPYS
jgi:hypothetical protein